MTIYGSVRRINGYLFSSKLHQSKIISVCKSPYPILFYLATHLTTCYCNDLTPQSNKFVKTTTTEEKPCKRETLSVVLKNFSSSSNSFQHQMMEFDIFPNLQKIGVLNNNNILIKDKENVDKLLSSLLYGSFDKLQLVVDFDYTLTRGHFNDEKALCSWGILDNSPRMPPFYRERASELLSRFYPIEIDPNRSEEEKIPHMIEWYHNIVDLLKKCKLSKNSIRHMVAESYVKFRDGTDKMFKKLKDEDVPTLIFSAGMGDVLEHVLWHFDVYTENVKVVSNFFKYNEEDVMIGFKGDLIHMFNKNENAIHSSDYFERLKGRSNVILMGDSLGDIKMAVGVPQSSSVLKIGFLNESTVNDRISSYTDAYDIVLVGDQTMSVVNSILSEIKH